MNATIQKLIVASIMLVSQLASGGTTTTKNPYVLAMSQDKELCESMLGLYNTDINTYGRIDYAAHEIFSRIKWKDIHTLRPDPYRIPQQAVFDINNDGNDELVIKTIWPVLKAFVETLFIFPKDSDVLSKLNPGKGGEEALFSAPNILFSSVGSNSSYYLMQVPQSLQEKIAAYKFKQLRRRIDLKHLNDSEIRKSISSSNIGPSFVLQPFIWHGTTYISMTDLGRPEWIVVGKYKQAEEVQDVCYFYDDNHRFVTY